MENEILNFSVAGAVIVFVIKELFSYLSKNKSEASISKSIDAMIEVVHQINNSATSRDSALADALKSMTRSLDNVTRAMSNSDMMLELIQERMRTHEDSARDRHSLMVKHHETIDKTIAEHGKDCRDQARLLMQHKVGG